MIISKSIYRCSNSVGRMSFRIKLIKLYSEQRTSSLEDWTLDQKVKLFNYFITDGYLSSFIKRTCLRGEMSYRRITSDTSITYPALSRLIANRHAVNKINGIPLKLIYSAMPAVFRNFVNTFNDEFEIPKPLIDSLNTTKGSTAYNELVNFLYNKYVKSKLITSRFYEKVKISQSTLCSDDYSVGDPYRFLAGTAHIKIYYDSAPGFIYVYDKARDIFYKIGAKDFKEEFKGNDLSEEDIEKFRIKYDWWEKE